MKKIILLALALTSFSSMAQSNTLQSARGEEFITCNLTKCSSQLKTYYDLKDYTGSYVSVITETGEFDLGELDVLINELEIEVADKDDKLKASREKLIKLGYRKKKLERIMKIFEEVMVDRELLHQGLVGLKSVIKSNTPSSTIVPMLKLKEFLLSKASTYKMIEVDIQDFYEPK